jgi:hypothetical protein
LKKQREREREENLRRAVRGGSPVLTLKREVPCTINSNERKGEGRPEMTGLKMIMVKEVIGEKRLQCQ